MNKIVLTISILLIGFSNLKSQPRYSIPENVKTILFLGNSITYAGQYISFIDAYYTITYPDKDYSFINVGLPSETVSGLSEPNHADGKFPRPDLHDRLDRILAEIKPDLVLACYGMNDGIYLPWDESRFKKFKDGTIWMYEKVVNSGAEIIHITPPIYDERKGEAYANTLDIYSDWLISTRYTKNWNIIDIHWPMKKYIEDRRLTDSTFVFAKDGVHPNEIGHWVIAKEILLYLGEDVSKAKNMLDALSNPKKGELLKLVEQQQALMKDAWLTHIGHSRPGMRQGEPLESAQLKKKKIREKIEKLLK